MPSSQRVLALDPGYERLGVAVVEKQHGKDLLLYSACIRTKATDSFPERLRQLGQEVEALMEEWRPSSLALEDLFFSKNEKTAMRVAEVRGMLLYLAAARGLAIYQYSPQEVKIAITGYGKGTKSAIALMIPRLVSLPARNPSTGLRIQRLDDELDAIAVALTCLASVR